MCAVHADAPAVQAPKTGKRAPRVDSSQPNRVRCRYTARSSTRVRRGSPVVAAARLCICIDPGTHFRLTLGQALEEACQTVQAGCARQGEGIGANRQSDDDRGREKQGRFSGAIESQLQSAQAMSGRRPAS